MSHTESVVVLYAPFVAVLDPAVTYAGNGSLGIIGNWMKSLHLLYHELRPVQSRYSYVVPCGEFEAHCELFARLRATAAGNAYTPEITFDDGHTSDLQFAVPILQEHGLKATFFITVGWTGQRPGYMTWGDLRALHAAGHTLGAHGMTHQLLTKCTPTELDQELRGARLRLEDGLGAPITSMSLPGGRTNARVINACKAAGFRQVYTSVPRAEDMRDQPLTVGRLNLVSGTTVEWLERVLDPKSGTLAKLERVARAKAAAQRLLGDRLYAQLWALGNRQEAELAEDEVPLS